MATFVSTILFLFVALIYGLPAYGVYGLVVGTEGGWRLLAVVCAPLVYALGFVVTAGLLSWPFQRHIIAGKFPRDVKHPVYRGRRFYGLCWTAVFYCKPVYWLCLTLPWLKWVTFRLFGYKGQMDFTLYPDTWIRDLPLLDFGEGVYVANRATLGTNMPLKNGKILVAPIRIGARSLVGHLTAMGAGTDVGEDVEIESCGAIGIRVVIGSRTHVGPACGLNHYCKIGSECDLGARCHVPLRGRVADKQRIGEFVNATEE